MGALRAAFIGDTLWLQVAIVFFWTLWTLFVIGLVKGVVDAVRAKRGR